MFSVHSACEVSETFLTMRQVLLASAWRPSYFTQIAPFFLKFDLIIFSGCIGFVSTKL